MRYTILSLAIGALAAQSAAAEFIPLRNATATFSQPAGSGVPAFNVSQAIDGDFGTGANGWAIARAPDFLGTSPETAVFETVSDAGFAQGTMLTFTLYQLHANPNHTLGRFRLSLTTDARDSFADGLQTGGDVVANWIILNPTSASSTGGAVLSILGDGSILASGPSPGTAVYTVTAITNLVGISGVRLEALADPALPQDGPGRRGQNGNFVLTEFQVDAQAVPEPSSLDLASLGIAGLVVRASARRRVPRRA